jgi:hypothetical protein
MLRKWKNRAGTACLPVTAITLLAVAFSAAGYALSPVIAINEEAKKTVVHPQLVRGDISVIEGSGGNITVLSRPKGKLLVDGGIVYSKDTLIKRYRRYPACPPSL